MFLFLTIRVCGCFFLIQLVIFRDLSNFMKCEQYIENVINIYNPTKIIFTSNNKEINNYYQCKFSSWMYQTSYKTDRIISKFLIPYYKILNNNLNLKFGQKMKGFWNMRIFDIKKHLPTSYAVRQAIEHAHLRQFMKLSPTASSSKREKFANFADCELIASDISVKYGEPMEWYSYLLDIFTLSVLENSELMKRRKSWKILNYNSEHRLNDKILYCISPYLIPHQCLLDRLRNDWTMYSINGILNENEDEINKYKVKNERILVISNGNATQDLIYKLIGKTKYNFDVFSDVDDKNVIIPSKLQIFPRYENFQLSNDEWDVVRKTFGKTLAEFLRYETDNRRELFNLQNTEGIIKLSEL